MNKLQVELWDELRCLSGEDVLRLMTQYHGMQLLSEQFRLHCADEGFIVIDDLEEFTAIIDKNYEEPNVFEMNADESILNGETVLYMSDNLEELWDLVAEDYTVDGFRMRVERSEFRVVDNDRITYITQGGF